MKKTLFLAILAGAALAGCVKNEEVAMSSGSSPERIKFDAPVVSVPTRATEIYGNYPGDKDFAVWALYHEEKFEDASAFDNPAYYMKDVKCTADDSTTPTTWNPEGNYYWPAKGYLTFAAYAPSEVDATWDATGFTFADFTVEDLSTNQIDLLYSDRQYNKQNTSDNVVTDKPYDGITIPFKHALSSIVFTARTEGEYTDHTITLTGIKVNNVVNKGTFKQNLLASTSGDTDKNSETDTDNEPAWTLDATAGSVKSYTVYPLVSGSTLPLKYDANGIGEYVNGDVDSDDDKYDPTDGNTPSTPNGTPADENTIYTNDGVRRSDLILIPQSLTKEEGDADNVTVVINYSITSTITNADNTTTTVTKDHEATFQLAVAPTSPTASMTYDWEMGKRYIYNIVIGLNKIYFNPTVTNWTDTTGSAIQIK